MTSLGVVVHWLLIRSMFDGHVVPSQDRVQLVVQLLVVAHRWLVGPSLHCRRRRVDLHIPRSCPRWGVSSLQLVVHVGELQSGVVRQ